MAIKNQNINILVFDSNSSDNTVSIAKEKQAHYSNIYLYTENQKSGLGSAYVKAMKIAIIELKADFVFEFDADGSHQPKYIPAMIALLENGADVVVGSRYVKSGGIPSNWGLHRKLLSILGNWVTRIFFTRKYKDYTSGFRGTKTEFLEKINLEKLISKNYAYKLHLFWELHVLGANIVEYPIEFIDRKKGYSKFPKNNLIESLKVVVTLRIRTLRRYFSICLVGLSGMLLQLLSYNIFRYMIHPVYANIVSIQLAILSNFLLNNKISFCDRRLNHTNKKRRYLIKFIQFNIFSLGSMLGQTVILWLGIGWLGHGVVSENIFVILGIIIGSIYNYFVYSHIIWKRNKKDENY